MSISPVMPVGIDSWESLIAAHETLVAGGELPESGGFLRKEIRDSWERCVRAGVDPLARDLAEPVSDEDFDRILEIYNDVIEALTPLVGMIDALGLENDYILEFVARNGVAVMKSGNLNLHEIVYARSVMNELTMGTNAHTLCMRHRMPTQVVGPEHYCAALHHIAGVACPVFDKRGTVIGSLLLTQPTPDEPWSASYQKLLSHALGLLVSMAATLESQLVFRESQIALEDASGKLDEASSMGKRIRHVLDVTVGTSVAPVVIVNSAGLIQHASPETMHTLKRDTSEVIGAPVEEILGLSWPDEFLPWLEGDRGYELSKRIGANTYTIRGTLAKSDDSDEIEALVLRLFRAEELPRSDKRVGDSAPITFEDILGKSSAMSIARTIARRFARTTENVLIVGDSGTGKEYFAQAIHNVSRPHGPFMSINCAAIPPRLIESELFGYEGGSFTGAERTGKPGKIELANGGTLFLDEIGDMPLELQATLLRVLENKRVMRVGGKGYKQVDFRVVAATNRNLPAMVAEGKFREDLLYRLSILTIELPPLRDREGDILFFAHYFLNECRSKTHEGPSSFSPEAEHLIETFSWPGNVRQLKNVIYSAFYAATGNEIREYDLPQYVREGRAVQFGGFAGPSAKEAPRREPHAAEIGVLDVESVGGGSPFQGERMTPAVAPPGVPAESASENIRVPSSLMTLREMEEAAIRLAMVHSLGNVAKAAEMLGISKATLYRKLKEFGIDQNAG